MNIYASNVKKKHVGLGSTDVLTVILALACTIAPTMWGAGFNVRNHTGLGSIEFGNTTPCRMTGVTLHSDVQYTEI